MTSRIEVEQQLDLVLAKDPRFEVLKKDPAMMELLSNLILHSHEYADAHDAHHVFGKILEAVALPSTSVQTVEQQVDIAPSPQQPSHHHAPGAA